MAVRSNLNLPDDSISCSKVELLFARARRHLRYPSRYHVHTAAETLGGASEHYTTRFADQHSVIADWNDVLGCSVTNVTRLYVRCSSCQQPSSAASLIPRLLSSHCNHCRLQQGLDRSTHLSVDATDVELLPWADPRLRDTHAAAFLRTLPASRHPLGRRIV